MSYKWRIDKDLIDTGAENRIRGSGIGTLYREDQARKFKMLDDDGEEYYLGTLWMTDSEEDSNGEVWFAPLDEFGTPNAGATSIEFWNDTKGKWEQI